MSEQLPTLIINSSPELVNVTERLHGEALYSVIENYLRYYASGAGHTAKAKRYDLQYFLEFLAGSSDKIKTVQVYEWTMQSTKDFIDHRLALGEAPTTVGRRLATIKHFGRTLAERVHGFINPAREVKSPGFQVERPQGLSIEEIRALRYIANEQINNQEKVNFTLIRNKFLLELLLSTGLRADEVRLLIASQISPDGSWLKNVKTKGKKYRNVYIDSDLRSLLQAYLTEREEELNLNLPAYENLSSNEKLKFPVIISLRKANISRPLSCAMDPKSIWRVINAYGILASRHLGNDSPGLHPHKLRHTFAHGLLETSKDIRLVAQALGHSDVRTTMRYTERTDQELAKAIEQRLNQTKA